MQFDLPLMLKKRPRQFWGILRSRATKDLAIPTAEFVKYNESIFFDSSIAPE